MMRARNHSDARQRQAPREVLPEKASDDPMWHVCVCCGIGPCDCAEIDPKTGIGCAECFECNVEKEAGNG